jgi:putative transposase
MPGQLRLEYPGAIYHVMSRANGKGNIFETHVDRQDFVKTLAETCAKTGFQVHACCLMRHRFHLAVETPQGNLEEP